METMEQKINQYIEYVKSKLQPHLLKYYMLDCYYFTKSLLTS